MKHKNLKIGPTMKKVLLLLETGLILGLTHRPDSYFKILKTFKREWSKIDKISLHKTVKNLYKSRLIDSKENEDGSVTMVLTEKGKSVALRYNIEKLKLPKFKNWDGLWKMVLFDIPEFKKGTRDALSFKLKQLGFYSFQKSAFIYPYECKKEIDFLIEFFELRPYVRTLTVKETDIDPDLRRIFNV